jgi:hypothetical protein
VASRHFISSTEKGDILMLNIGTLGFGVVVGWITYKILVRIAKPSWADLTSVIGAVGGAAVLSLFPAQTDLFGWYAVGLFIGFFGYFVVFIAMARVGGAKWLDILAGKKVGSIMRAKKDPFEDEE